MRGADARQAFPAGSFYSPIVDTSLASEQAETSRIWPDSPADPAGIDFRGAEQLALLEQLSVHRLPLAEPWPDPPYVPTNDQFPPQDAAVLYGMVRHVAPRRIVEVGSGWSTTVTARGIADGDLDTELVCIEPYPRDWLPRVREIAVLRQERVEQTPVEVFDRLGSGDVLFIDSSHVAKAGSDVAHLFLHVLPRLREGVLVHVHDIFLPLEYPRGWVLNGFNWNEQYVLQAYLTGNVGTTVVCANRWLTLRHPDSVRKAFGAGCASGGSSFWFRVGPQGF